MEFGYSAISSPSSCIKINSDKFWLLWHFVWSVLIRSAEGREQVICKKLDLNADLIRPSSPQPKFSCNQLAITMWMMCTRSSLISNFLSYRKSLSLFTHWKYLNVLWHAWRFLPRDVSMLAVPTPHPQLQWLLTLVW